MGVASTEVGPSRYWSILTVLCATAAGFGWWQFARQHQEHGSVGAVPEIWPTALGARPAGSMALLFLHPACPCSRATLDVLEAPALAGRLPPTRVYVYTPRVEPAGWPGDRGLDRVRSWPGFVVMPDPDGELAQSLGVHTSGQVLAFDASGVLRFQGGVTLGRGSATASSGLDVLLSLEFDPRRDRRSSPAYGCDLVGRRP